MRPPAATTLREEKLTALTMSGNFCPPDTRKREFVITILAAIIALIFVAIVGVMLYRRRVALRAKLAKLFSGDPNPILNR